ncbi:MAG: phosphatase PAP2 family protein [Candidatus Bathyarchaeia archaeon]|nr:phosphatase PAP2 family protein [Candidatus Bathyarchaeota archaeon]
MSKYELIKFDLIKVSFLATSALIFLFLMDILEKLLLKIFNIKGSVWVNLFDEKIFFWVINNNSRLLNVLMLTVTYVGSTISWFIAGILLWFLRKRKEAFLLVFALLIGGVLTFFMKIAFHRIRPFQIIIETKVLEREEGFSFPSGHSVSSFSSAIILERKIKKIYLSFFIYALAFLIGYSRVYIGVHWPLDVVFGGIIGLTIGFITLKFEEKILSFFIKSEKAIDKTT